MPRATYNDLIKEVRAQIAVDDTQAYTWLLDRSRVLNAEASWLVSEELLDPPVDLDGRYYELPDEAIWVEAVLAGDYPYQRSTLHAMDARWTGRTGNTHGIYCEGYGHDPLRLQIHPPTTQALSARIVSDVADDRTAVPPFPTDFDGALVDGAVAMGLARMDERFDSASYMDQRFQSAIGRLTRRRHARIGRGATAIRIVQ